MRSFELQIYKDGKWKMDSVFDDRTCAIDEARKADESNRNAGVRVIEENYDEASNLTTTRTLFRGGVARGQKAQNPVSKAKVNSKGGIGQEPDHKDRRKRHSKKTFPLVPVLVLLVVILGGLVVLLGQQYISSLQ